MIILFSDEEKRWLWTLLTDPQILAAIIGFIGTIIGAFITTYQCCKQLVLHTC